MRLDSRMARWGVVAVLAGAGLLTAVVLYGDGSYERAVAKSLLATIVFFVLVTLLLDFSSEAKEPDAGTALRANYGFLAVALGKDGRLSTGKTVVAVWTTVLALMLVFLSGMVWFGRLATNLAFGGDWNDYFLLLGGPFAAAVAAKGIVVKKLQDNPGMKTVTAAAAPGALGLREPNSTAGPTVAGHVAPAAATEPAPLAATGSATGPAASATPPSSERGGESADAAATSTSTSASSSAPPPGGPSTGGSGPSARDLVTSDEGNADLIDTQYVVFSLVAMIYVIGTFAAEVVRHVQAGPTGLTESGALHLPDIPSALLGLTSAAALTYVGNKAVQQSGVRLVRGPSAPVACGADVSVLLVNAGAATLSNTVVLLSPAGSGAQPMPQAVAPSRAPTPTGGVTTVTFEAPSPAGTWQVTVQTPGGETTPFTLVTT
jgi:hypothetical protein